LDKPLPVNPAWLRFCQRMFEMLHKGDVAKISSGDPVSQNVIPLSSFTKPDVYTMGTFVDLAHEPHLVISLQVAGLIDAQRIDPNQGLTGLLESIVV
jgi:hypothetical protein